MKKIFLCFVIILFSATMANAVGFGNDPLNLGVSTLDRLRNDGILLPDGTIYPESGYRLTEVSAPIEGKTITKYEIHPDTKEIIPHYYEVTLKRTEYDDPTGDTTEYYEWTKDVNGNNVISKVVTPTDVKTTITVKYNSATNSRIENTNDDSSVPKTGNYVGLNFVTTSKKAHGGAINNNGAGAKLGDINAAFVGNYTSASATYSSAYGGAIFNSGEIGNINGDFLGNNTTSINTGSSSNGGAIYNNGSSAKILNITGNFIGNYTQSPYASLGGAIFNDENGTIGNITGDFLGNYVSARSTASGGAIFNESSSKIGSITGDFLGNYVLSTVYTAYGGAIYNAYEGVIENITGDFIGNYVSSTGDTATGGAISNWSGVIGNKDSSGSLTGGIVNSSFINNSAISICVDDPVYGVAKGGAIYNGNSDLNIIANNGSSFFHGNKTIANGIEESNAIYMAQYIRESDLDNPDYKFTPNTLKLEAKNNGIILFDDKINGGVYYLDWYNDNYVYVEDSKYAYKLSITGDETGKVILNNSVDNAHITLSKTNLYLGRENVFEKAQSLTLDSGSLFLTNNSVGTLHIPEFNLNANTNIAVDVDLKNESMDRIAANKYGIVEGSNLNVAYINLLNDAEKFKTDIKFADQELAGSVSYSSAIPIAYSPIYKYDVVYNPANGMFSFAGGPGNSTNPQSPDNFNPAVLTAPVAQQAAYLGAIDVYNQAFANMDMTMLLPRPMQAVKMRNKYATSDSNLIFTPTMIPEEEKGAWFRPYSTFENVPLKNGPTVSNVSYGSLFGIDSPITETKYGFNRVLTAYTGYTGSHQTFQGNSIYQNGGLIGATAVFYKGNFFSGLTANAGALQADASTMYGTENFTMLTAGIASKSGYNFSYLMNKLIVQPSFMMSYTFVNTFDYKNKANIDISQSPLNAIQIAPSIKLIGNLKNGWQPYASVTMIWNIMDETNFKANEVSLPEMSVKPFVLYGLGVQKRVGEKFTGFAQAMLRSGGRNGIGFMAGFRWALGNS